MPNAPGTNERPPSSGATVSTSSTSPGATVETDSETETIDALAPAPHELGANLIFTEHGLRPYFALDSVVKAGGGTSSATVEHGGETFDVELYYQDSGLKPPDRDDFRLTTVREFRVRARARAAPRERKASFLISPRWPGMESKGDGPNPSGPPIEGVNVRSQGSNLALDSYPDLLRKAAAALDVNSRYFDRVHAYSNIYVFELYVRLRRSKARAVVGRNGPLERIFEHVAGESKFRELREDSRGIEGYHHRTAFDSAGAAALLPGHSLAKKIKHYHPKHVRDDPDDPLYHPKLGVSLARKANASGTVAWSDRGDLARELDETLLNVLAWSGLPPRADESIYVSDAYFSPRETSRPLTLIDDPTPEIERRQELVAINALASGLTDSDRETVEIVADGGRTPEELAAEIGVSKRTIYRVVRRLANMLRLKNGSVRFVSEYLADVVSSALASAADAIDRDSDSGGETSAFVAWCRRHGVEYDDPRDARLQLRVGHVAADVDVNALLRRGLFAWIDAGRNPRRFKAARFSFISDGIRQVKVGL